jgi:hypothetical protein
MHNAKEVGGTPKVKFEMLAAVYLDRENENTAVTHAHTHTCTNNPCGCWCYRSTENGCGGSLMDYG